MIRSVLARCSFALLGGLALFLADYPVSQPWLVLLAFVPLLWVVLAARSRREACTYGIFWGLGRTVPLAYMLGSFGLPLPARFAVEGYLLGLDAAFALVAFELRGIRACPLLMPGILSVDRVRRFRFLASFWLRSGAHVQAVRSAPVLAKASPKLRTCRTGVP
ncbi:MAG: hypothetical protein ABI548_23235 [Polyangiaceae bacterium]